MAKTRNGVKNSKSRHQPYSKRTQSQTENSQHDDGPQDPTSQTEPDPEYIPRTSRKTTSRNFSLNVDNDDSEPVSKNLRSRNSLENSRFAGLENNRDPEQNSALQTSGTISNYQNSVRNASSETQAPNSSILTQENNSSPIPNSSVPNPIQTNSNNTQNLSVPVSVSNSENSSSSRRRSTRKRKRNSAPRNGQNGQNSQSTVPNVQNTAVSNTESQSSAQNSTQITENNSSSIFSNPEINNLEVSNEDFDYSSPLNEVATTSHSISVQTNESHTQTQPPNSINSYSAEPNTDSNDSQGENSVENGTLSPYQRVTRNLYRTGAVNDPDIELDVFEEYARIRMGTMNMTVSMKENQTVVFRFDSNPGLNFWSNSDTYPPIQPVNPQSFPDLLPLPRLVEHKIKDLASSCENNRTFGINDLNRIFNELQDISDSHPVALIMISILEALDKIPPSGQLEDIAFVIPDIQRAFEKLDLPSLKGGDGEDDSGSICDFDGHGKPITGHGDSEENGDEGDEGDNCSICLSGLITQFPLAQLKVCKHVFHVDCLKSWHTVKYTCPLCRSHLSPLKVKLEYRMHSI